MTLCTPKPGQSLDFLIPRNLLGRFQKILIFSRVWGPERADFGHFIKISGKLPLISSKNGFGARKIKNSQLLLKYMSIAIFVVNQLPGGQENFLHHHFWSIFNYGIHIHFAMYTKTSELFAAERAFSIL